jgi:hypothetical protein
LADDKHTTSRRQTPRRGRTGRELDENVQAFSETYHDHLRRPSAPSGSFGRLTL